MKKSSSPTRCGFCAPLLLLLSALAAPAQVVINEIMYHPASGNLNESYVELRNTAATNVNLAGWRFSKGLDFAFPTNSLLLAPGGYLVVAADAPTFTAKYPSVANFVAG